MISCSSQTPSCPAIFGQATCPESVFISPVQICGATSDGDIYRAYDILKKHGVFVEVPGGISADEFILLRADREGSHVISNDQFRDFSKLYSWVSDGGRLIKGAVAGAKLTIPQLDIDVPILPNALLTAESLIA